MDECPCIEIYCIVCESCARIAPLINHLYTHVHNVCIHVLCLHVHVCTCTMFVYMYVYVVHVNLRFYLFVNLTHTASSISPPHDPTVHVCLC